MPPPRCLPSLAAPAPRPREFGGKVPPEAGWTPGTQHRWLQGSSPVFGAPLPRCPPTATLTARSALSSHAPRRTCSRINGPCTRECPAESLSTLLGGVAVTNLLLAPPSARARPRARGGAGSGRQLLWTRSSTRRDRSQGPAVRSLPAAWGPRASRTSHWPARDRGCPGPLGVGAELEDGRGGQAPGPPGTVGSEARIPGRPGSGRTSHTAPRRPGSGRRGGPAPLLAAEPPPAHAPMAPGGRALTSAGRAERAQPRAPERPGRQRKSPGRALRGRGRPGFPVPLRSAQPAHSRVRNPVPSAQPGAPRAAAFYSPPAFVWVSDSTTGCGGVRGRL